MGYGNVYESSNTFSTDLNNFSTGAPTISSDAVYQNQTIPTVSTGVQPQAAAGAPVVTPPASPGATPGADPASGGFLQPGGGASIALGAIQVLGSLWNSFQQNKLAKEQFAFEKEAYATNLKNQTQSYNTELEDRINARYATEGRTDAAGQAADYVSKNKL